jgi:hypothetical protein
LAYPCEGCWAAIKSFGIRQVRWTLDNDGFGNYI